MKTCININHPDIIKLSKDLNIPKTVIAAKVALWQKENNNYEKFPTLEHLVKGSDFYKSNEERFSPYSVEKIVKAKDIFLKEKYFYDSDVKSSEELLTMIAASEHPLNKVAKHLIPYVQDIANVDIELVDEILNVDGSIRDNLSGAYYQDYNGKPMIFIRKTSSFRNGGSEPTIIHEILHSLTVEALSKDNENVEKFEQLYNQAIKHLGNYDEKTNTGYYALKNVREFIVALFTDSKFIKALSEIPSTNNVKPSLLREIFDYILSILNIDTENSLYKDAYAVATSILDDAVEFNANKKDFENAYKEYEEYLKKVGSDYPIEIDEGYDPTIFYNVEDYYIPLNYKTNLELYKQFNLLNIKNELKTIPYKSIDDVNKAIKWVNTLNNNEKYKFQLKKFAKNGKEVYHILIFNKKPNDVLFDQSEKEIIKDTNEKQYQKVATGKKDIEQVTLKHRSITALKDLSAKLAWRTGAKVKFVYEPTVDWRGYNEGNLIVLNEALMKSDTPFHEVSHSIIRAIRNVQKVNDYAFDILESDMVIGYEDKKGYVVVNYDNTINFDTFYNTIEEAKAAIPQIKSRLQPNSQLYQNLLKELEYGRGLEVLNQVKKDYAGKPLIEDVDYYTTIQENGLYQIHSATVDDETWITDIEDYDIADFIKKKSMDNLFTLEEQQEEAIVTLLGMMAAEKLDTIENATLISLLKQLWNQISDFVKSLLKQDSIAINDLPVTTTLNDLAEILGYGSNKIILPGYKVEYRTPLGNSYDTLQEVNNELTMLIDKNTEIDLSNIEINEEISNIEKQKIESLNRKIKDLEDRLVSEEYIADKNEKLEELNDKLDRFYIYESPIFNNNQFSIDDVDKLNYGLNTAYGANVENTYSTPAIYDTYSWEYSRYALHRAILGDSYEGYYIVGTDDNHMRKIIPLSIQEAEKLFNKLPLEQRFNAEQRNILRHIKHKIQDVTDDAIIKYDISRIRYEIKNIIEQGGIRKFIKQNNEFEKVRKIIEEWKRINNIVYNPEEVYSRGQEFIHYHNAYTYGTNTELWLQNIIDIILDKEKINAKVELSFVSTPVGERFVGMATPIDPEKVIYIEVFPKSEDIAFASTVDNYTSSFGRQQEFIEIFTNHKNERVGIMMTKSISQGNLHTIEPNLAITIDKVAHHNEYAIALTPTNFRIRYGPKTDYKLKKLIDSVNKILDDKFGKIVKPEIKAENKKYIVQKKNYNTSHINEEIKEFNTLEEAKRYKDRLENKYYQEPEVDEDGYLLRTLEDDFFEIIKSIKGIQPTQTEDTLVETMNNVVERLDYRSSLLPDKFVIKGANHNYATDTWYYKENDEWYSKYVPYETPFETQVDSYDITKLSEVGLGIEEVWDSYITSIKDEINVLKSDENENKDKIESLENIIKAEDNIHKEQALINLKLAALREVGRKYSRVLVTSEVVPIDHTLIFRTERQYSKVNTPKKENIKFNIIHDKKLSPFAETVAKEILEYDAYYKAKKIAERKGASKEEIAEYKAIIESESFKKMIDTPLNLGHPSEILKAAGMADLPIMVSREHFQEHIIEEVRHKISKAEEVQQIVRDINSPLAIYRNREENGSYQNKYEILTGSANDKGDKIVFILQSDVRIESYKDTVMGTVKNIMGNKVITGFAVPNLGRLEAATHNKDLLFANSSYLENTYDNAKNRDLAKKHGNIKYTLDNLKRVLNLINNFSNPTPILKIRFDSQQLGTLNGDLNGELIQSLIDKLQSTFSQFKNISIVYNISEFAERAREYGINESSIQQLTDSKGNVYGAVLPDGTIYIDKNNFNVSTLIHEHSHLWNQVVKKTKPKLWEQIKKAIKKTQYWSDVVNNEDYDYLNGDEDAIADEAFARLVGDYGNDNWQGILELSNNKSLFNQILQLLQKYFNFIVETLGFESNLKAENFAKLSLFEIISGQPLKINSPNIDKQFNELSSDIKESFKSELLDVHTIVNSGFERSTDIGTLINMVQIKRGYRNIEGYMLAPNDELTNLSENDWLYVRTDEFTSRHGDWFNQDASFTYNLDENGEPILSQAKQSEPVIRFAKIRNERLFKHVRDNIHIEGVDTMDIYKSLMSAGFNSWDFEDKQIPFIKVLVNKLYNVENSIKKSEKQFNLVKFEETTNGKLIKLETVKDVEKYKKYYRRDEVLCTFNNIEGRLEKYDIWVFIKNDVDDIEPFDDPDPDDDYSTSVMMFQRKKGSNKGSDYIISRYNHSVNNPNFLFNAIFDNFYEGLSEYLGQDLKKVSDNLSNNYIIQDNKIYKYDTEINGDLYYYSKTGMLKNGFFIPLNPDYQKYYKYGMYIDTKDKNIIVDAFTATEIGDIKNTLFHPSNKSLYINEDGIFGDNGQMLTNNILKSNITRLDTNLYHLYLDLNKIEYPELTAVYTGFQIPPNISFLDISKLEKVTTGIRIFAHDVNFPKSWKDGTGKIDGYLRLNNNHELWLDTVSRSVVLTQNAKLTLKTLGNTDSINDSILESSVSNNATLIVENALMTIRGAADAKIYIKKGTEVILRDNSTLLANELEKLEMANISSAIVNKVNKVDIIHSSKLIINIANSVNRDDKAIIVANDITSLPKILGTAFKLGDVRGKALANKDIEDLAELDDKMKVLNSLFDNNNIVEKPKIDKIQLLSDALKTISKKDLMDSPQHMDINELPLIIQHVIKNPIVKGNTLENKIANFVHYYRNLPYAKKNTTELYPLIKYPITNLKLKEHESITAEKFIAPYKDKVINQLSFIGNKKKIKEFNRKKGFNNIKLIERFDGNHVAIINNEDTVEIRKAILKHLDYNQYEELDRPWFHYIKLPVTQEFKIKHDNIFFNLGDELAPIYIMENKLDKDYVNEVKENFKKELDIIKDDFHLLSDLTDNSIDLNNYTGLRQNNKPAIFYMKDNEISAYNNGGREIYINNPNVIMNDSGIVISNEKNNIIPINNVLIIKERKRFTDDYYIDSLIDKYKISNYLLLEEAELLKDQLEKRMKIDKQSYTITFDKNGNFVKLIFTMNDDNILSNLNFSPSIINNLLVNNIVLEDMPNEYRKVLHSKVLDNELNDDFTCTI